MERMGFWRLIKYIKISQLPMLKGKLNQQNLSFLIVIYKLRRKLPYFRMRILIVNRLFRRNSLKRIAIQTAKKSFMLVLSINGYIISTFIAIVIVYFLTKTLILNLQNYYKRLA